MKNKYLLTTLLCCLIMRVALAQSTIKGTVKTADGKFAELVHVTLKGQAKGTTTNTNGEYELTEIQAGSYVLVASFIGLETKQQAVIISTNETVVVDFVLTHAGNTLQTVEVTGRKQTSYKNDNSFSAAKIEMRIVDIPQTISSVTKELMQDRQAVKLNDVVQNVAGVTQFSNYDDVVMRGFRNSGSEGRLINGLRTINTYGVSPMLINIERVEFIKGPASAIFANTNPGGTINMITKKPLDETRKSIQFTAGSYNTIRATADFTGPLDDEKKWLYRVNVGYQSANTFRNNINNDAVVIAPSISFLPKEGTRFNADLVYSNYKTQFDRGITLTNNTKNIYEMPVGANIGMPTDFLNQQNIALTLSFSQQLAKNFNVNASYLKVTANEQRNEHGINDYITADSIQMSFYDVIIQQTGDNASAYFTYKANTGQLAHTLMAGYDYITSSYKGYDRYTWGATNGVADFSLIHPVYTKRNVNQYTFDPANSGTYLDRYFTQGIYVQDLIKFKRLQILASLRQEFYTYPKSDGRTNLTYAQAQKQQKLLPRIGATYRLSDNINVYATYAEGYQPQEGGTLSNARTGGPFDPLTSTLYEAGAKAEFFNKALFVGTALYQITQNNVLVSANDISNPNLLRQRGQEQSTGVEIEAGGRITTELSVQVSYAYNDAKITKDVEGDPDHLVGRTKENAPKSISGSWIKYGISSGKLRGLGFGFGHSQVSGHRNTYDLDLQLPGYFIMNAALYLKADRFQLGVNVNNLADKKYMVGGFSYTRVFPGAPRNFTINVGYTF